MSIQQLQKQPMTSTTISNWLKCAHWLNDCEALPDIIRQKLNTSQLKFEDFAEAIRDGTCLCRLLEYLAPTGTQIDLSQLNQHCSNIRSLSLKNIQLFLEKCTSSPFNMSENDLFAPEMLYDLNLEPVIVSLSCLSNLRCVQSKSNGGFYVNAMEEDSDEFQQLYNKGQLKDTGIYCGF